MNPESASPTVLDVVQSTTAYFSRHNIENPRLNAEHLIAHALGKKRLEMYLEFDRSLDESLLKPMRELVRRRAQGEPLQHLLGTVEFCGRTFGSDSRALIPRPETEQLCELAIAECAIRNAGPAIVDVGTGSGVIALTLAAELPEARITAVDLAAEALGLARENAVRLGLSERVRFIESDLLASVEGRFSVVIANLPYISAAVVPTLAREVQHDPRSALDGGPGGHEVIARLIAQTPAHLEPGGFLALEIGGDQAQVLTAALQAADFTQIRCITDLQGVNRFLFANYG